MNDLQKTNDNMTAQQWYHQGYDLTLAGDYRQAIAALDQAIRKDVRLAEAYLARGACYYKIGSYQRATNDLNAAALLGCRDAQLWSKFENQIEDDDAMEEE
ncbi:MAG: tetratricopeptide repeat protein [Desulfobacterales bacterium]|nr:tetratricopeptide repeat protein [Desulfobacterales bacterium]MDJ0914295.1 tetratricopeptide repeat protein [Desulfobacterales bacterium]